MADTVKISALTEISSGALDDNSVIPVVDGGVTYKLPVTKLKAFVADTFATDTELSNQISVVNSSISGLDTSEVSENASYLYYTDARVKTKLNAEGVISGSSQVSIAYDDLTSIPDGLVSSSTQISASAAAAGFSSGTETIIPDGTISSSIQIDSLGYVNENVTSSMTVLSASYAETSSFALNAAGGGGGNDYISNVSYATSQLTFTGTGNAFDGTISLPFLPSLTYTADSASFQSRITSLAGGSVPNGTISSSAQISEFNLFAKLFGDDSIVSSSEQIVVANADLTGLTADNIGQGITNQYYTDNKVLTYINSLQVLSGSAGGGGALNDGIISSSDQIDALGFVTDAEQSSYSSSVSQRFDGISGVSLSENNIFTVEQRFEEGIKVTGSVISTGIFSGSGANLFNIPQSAIVGGASSNQIDEGDNLVSVSSTFGVRLQAYTGSVEAFASGGFNLNQGVFSGSGANLHSIPPSAIVGGVGGSGVADKIYSGSASASITPGGIFSVNTASFFDGNMTISGSIIADEISVGTTGTPTLFSATNLNLSASNAVVVTDSPFRLSPQTDATTGSFTLSNGDIVYSSTSEDFYGYKSGSWISLTGGGASSQGFGGTGIISSSEQIAENLPSGVVSSSRQVTATGVTEGDVLFSDVNGGVTSSITFAYTTVTDTLSVGNISTTDVTYTGTLSGNSDSTGSFGRLLGDTLLINNAVEFPSSDGSVNQVLKTDGAGNIGFATVETLITSQDITTTGIITVGTGSIIGTGSISLEDNLSVAGTINDQTIGSANTVIESTNVRVQSGGQLLLSSSNADLGVVIDDVLVLPERETKPNTPRTGSIIVSASASGPRPFFYDGTAWTQMFA